MNDLSLEQQDTSLEVMQSILDAEKCLSGGGRGFVCHTV